MNKYIFSMILALSFVISGINVYALPLEEAIPPVLNENFENYDVDTSFMDGTIVSFDNSKRLKLNVDRVGTKETFDALVVGESVISFDVAAKPGSVTGELEVQGGGTPAYLINFNKDSTVTTYNGKYICDYGLTPKKITIVYDTPSQHFDVYVNNHLVVKKCYVYYEHLSFDKVVNFGLKFASTTDHDDVYLDNILSYPSYKRCTIGGIYRPDSIPKDSEKNIVITGKDYLDDDSIPESLLNNCATVHMRSGIMFSNGKKMQLSQMPFYANDSQTEYMVPQDFFEFCFGINIVNSNGEITVGDFAVLNIDSNTILVNGLSKNIDFAPQICNGVLYLPIRAICENVLGKYVTFDNSTVHSGMVIVSNVPFGLPSGNMLQALNNFAFFERPTKEKIRADYSKSVYKEQHPRILATESDFEQLRSEIQINETKKIWFKSLINQCDNKILAAPTLKYELRDGVRLLFVAQDFSTYMITLAMAYKLTGDKKYFEGAWRQIEVVASMPDWNPSHHIDVGIMSVGFAIAYDWFYDVLSLEQKKLMEKAIYRNCLWTVNKAIESPNTAYTSVIMYNNHNVYCNYGVMAACMAFMDVYPEECSYISSKVIRILEYFLDKFAPLGSYYEGPGYATIAMNYTIGLFGSLYPSTGSLYGLDKAEGLNLSASYLTNLQSDVSSFNFADGSYGLVKAASSFWIYDHYNITGYKDGVASGIFYSPTAEECAYCLLWYNVKEEDASTGGTVLDSYYKNDEIVTMRNTYDPGQVFAGIKAGKTVYAHSHLDAGSFVFDAAGKRWAFDLGADDYNLYYKYDSWDVFRLRAESHNTLLINADGTPGYEIGSEAPVVRYETKPRGTITKIDMSALYGTKVSSAQRGYFFTDDRRSLVVRDEVNLSKNSDLYWLMYIDSDVEIVDNNTAILTDKTNKSRQLKVEFLSSTNGKIVVEDAKPFPNSPNLPEQKKNEGYYRLYYKITTGGNATITAKLTPMDFVGSDISKFNVPMDTWQIPDGDLGEVPRLDFLKVGNEICDVKDRNFTFTMKNEQSQIPDIEATSDKFDIKMTKAKLPGETTTIVVSDRNNPDNASLYKVSFPIRKKMKERDLGSYDGLNMTIVSVSSEPQPENGKDSVLDGDLSTRWSSSGENWIIFEIDEDVPFDSVLMSMYLGNERNSKVTVEISDDGVSYKKIADIVTSGTTEDYESYDVGTHTARFVKFGFYGTSSGVWNSPTEIAIAKKTIKK